MKPKEQILKFIQKAYASTAQTDVPEDSIRLGANFPQNEIIQELFDGMSSGTARIIIEQEVSKAIEEKWSE